MRILIVLVAFFAASSSQAQLGLPINIMNGRVDRSLDQRVDRSDESSLLRLAPSKISALLIKSRIFIYTVRNLETIHSMRCDDSLGAAQVSYRPSDDHVLFFEMNCKSLKKKRYLSVSLKFRQVGNDGQDDFVLEKSSVTRLR